MFQTSNDRQIDSELKNIAEEIEHNPSLSVLAARQFCYCLSQTPIKIEVAKSQQLNILEEFVFRAGVELNPPPTENELATVLGLDPIFIRNTTATLRNLNTLENENKSVIKLTPTGKEFYRDRSVPEASETRTIYAISQPFSNNLSFKSSPLENEAIDHLANIVDLVTIESKQHKIVTTLSPIKLLDLVKSSDLELHTPDAGKFVTSCEIGKSEETIGQSLALFLVFDILENKFKIQARKYKVLEDVSTRLNQLLTEEPNLLTTLFDFRVEKDANEITNNFKFELGLDRLSKAGDDPDFLCLALLSLHGALEDYFRHWLASNSSVPLSEREAFNFSKIQWKGLLDLMRQYGGLNDEQRDRIREMNKMRQPVGHGGQFAGTHSQLKEYADFVRGIIRDTK